MKYFFYILLFIGVPIYLFSQPTNYYQSCFGLSGEDLKSELHELINDHNSYSYTTTKNILRESDEDPNNPENVIYAFVDPYCGHCNRLENDVMKRVRHSQLQFKFIPVSILRHTDEKVANEVNLKHRTSFSAQDINKNTKK